MIVTVVGFVYHYGNEDKYNAKYMTSTIATGSLCKDMQIKNCPISLQSLCLPGAVKIHVL